MYTELLLPFYFKDAPIHVLAAIGISSMSVRRFRSDPKAGGS